MFKCPNCGADLKFSPKAKSVTCKYCEGTFDPKELKVHVKRAQEQNTFEGKSYEDSFTDNGVENRRKKRFM